MALRITSKDTNFSFVTGNKELIIRWREAANSGENVIFEELECSLCDDENYAKNGPSHNGSKNCESGSLASGGRNSHCTCDTCF